MKIRQPTIHDTIHQFIKFTMNHYILIIFIFRLSLATCQVLNLPRNQPFPLDAPFTLTCCNALNYRLQYCLEESSSAVNEIESTVSVVTFVSDNILEYANYALFVNMIHSEHQHYNFHVMSKNNKQNFQSSDPRWNKIKILSSGIDSTDGWAKKSEYLVWLDADLIMLDMGMDFSKIGDAFPDQDIFLSKDIDSAGGLGNTGFVLVRNTPWSIKFLNRWWNMGDRSRMSDQIALQLLYESLGDNDKEKLKILPTDAVNTHFPAWEHQKTHNQVLHLAGEANIYRKMVFQKGAMEICDSAVKGIVLPRQLNLTQENLYNLYLELTNVRSVELRKLLDFANQQRFSDDSKKNIEFIDNLYGKLTEILTHAEIAEGQVAPTQEYYNVAKDIYLFIFRKMSEFSLSLAEAEPHQLSSMEFLRHSISSGFDIFSRSQGQEGYGLSNDVINEIFQAIGDKLLPQWKRCYPYYKGSKNKLPLDYEGKLYYYEFKYESFKGEFLSEVGDMGEAFASLSRGLSLWRKLHAIQYYGIDYYALDPLKEGSRFIYAYGMRLCSTNDAKAGIPLLQEAVKLMETTYKGYEGKALVNPDQIYDEINAIASCYAALCYFLQHSYGDINSIKLAGEAALDYFNKLSKLKKLEGNNLAMARDVAHTLQSLPKRGPVEQFLDEERDASMDTSSSTSPPIVDTVDIVQEDQTQTWSNLKSSRAVGVKEGGGEEVQGKGTTTKKMMRRKKKA